MAVLSATELAELRNRAVRNLPATPTSPVTYDRTAINAALQAVETRLSSPQIRTTLASDIEAAAPGVFSANQKALIVGIWCLTAGARLGVS